VLEAPDLSADAVIACLNSAYGLAITEVEFLPLGADTSTAVYRISALDGAPYFLKLRRGDLFEPAVTIPHWLHEQGLSEIIAPLPTRDGALWARIEPFTTVLYPFIAGRHGADAPLSAQQLVEFGAALRRIHTADLPAALRSGIPQETYTPFYRDLVRQFQEMAAERSFSDPAAAQLAALFRDRRAEIDHCVGRAESLAELLIRQNPEHCLCHSDIHAWNLLVADSGEFYIVDWDTLIFAPKERDLMFIGAGHGLGDSAEDAARCYQGYGEMVVNRAALAYYRYERIVADISAYGESLLLTDEGGADREEMFQQMASQFGPGSVLEYARATEESHR
jgi:spectinomycin phosphotransferase